MDLAAQPSTEQLDGKLRELWFYLDGQGIDHLLGRIPNAAHGVACSSHRSEAAGRIRWAIDGIDTSANKVASAGRQRELKPSNCPTVSARIQTLFTNSRPRCRRWLGESRCVTYLRHVSV